MKSFILTSFLTYLFFLLNSTLYANEKHNSELIVEADNSIEFYEKEKYYLATGNAIASKDGIILKANTIKAFFNKKNKINKVVSYGNASITKGSILAKAGHVKYNFKNQFIILTQNTPSFKSEEIFIKSKEILSFDNSKKIANGRGKVELTLKNGIKIFTDELIANFSKLNNSLTKAKAKGNVVIVTKNERSSSNYAVFDKKTNLITLKENVIIKRNNSNISGEIGITNLKTGITKISGGNKKKRVKGKFLPSKN